MTFAREIPRFVFTDGTEEHAELASSTIPERFLDFVRQILNVGLSGFYSVEFRQ